MRERGKLVKGKQSQQRGKTCKAQHLNLEIMIILHNKAHNKVTEICIYLYQLCHAVCSFHVNCYIHMEAFSRLLS